MPEIIKLKTESLFNANFNLLQNDFTFVVNGDEFRTSKFIASLLSPAVSNLLLADESVDSFEINTNYSQGNFQILLNIIYYREQVIGNEDKEFLCELLEILQNKYLQIELNLCTSEITYENVFSELLYQLQYPHYYQEIIDKKIEILAENLYQILSKENERQILSELDLDIIERIVAHEKLVIETEDELLKFINSLYSKNRESRLLYQYVNFTHCTSTSIKTFLDHFSIEDMDQSIWIQMKERFEQSIQRNLNKTKRCQMLTIEKGIENFDGIFYHLQKQANNQIENEIAITSSPIYCNNENEYSPYHILQYNNFKYFRSINTENAWICFEFKNHQVIPTHYAIRSKNDGFHAPINYKIEISKDNLMWEEIDTQNAAPFESGKPQTLVFSIDENKQKEGKFIRLTQTGPNSSGVNYLEFDAIEFYGYLK